VSCIVEARAPKRHNPALHNNTRAVFTLFLTVYNSFIGLALSPALYAPPNPPDQGLRPWTSLRALPSDSQHIG